MRQDRPQDASGTGGLDEKSKIRKSLGPASRVSNHALNLYPCFAPPVISILQPMHYAKVAKICILKCPTLTSYFSVVFHQECTKFCIELCELPKNLGKEEENKIGEKKEEKSAKNMKGVFAKVTTGLKKSVLINATIFALCVFLANTP